ncbi:MAG: hypothetical protein JNM58_02535 [Xanthomonadaceae bacterium]|nr:hypothetical protein [Xanthomonadaceae bacterium]
MKTPDKARSFAFKLATDAKKQDEKKPAWQVRDGVAVAGCSGPDARADAYTPFYRRDAGFYC